MAIDFVKKVDELGSWQREFILSPVQWAAFSAPCDLEWYWVPFGRANRGDLPDEKGVYAFVVEPTLDNVFTHGYVMYIGQTGHESNHTLKKRFGDYLSNQRNINRRHGIHYLLNKWSSHLFFYFSEVDDSAVSLKSVEKALNDALLPPYSIGDLSAEIKDVRKVLR